MRNALPAIGLRFDLAARAHRALAAFDAFNTLRLVLTLGAFGTVASLGTVVALRALGALLAILTIAVLSITVAARRGTLLLAIIVILALILGGNRFVAALVIVLVAAATLILLLEARAAIFEHAEIMIRELKVIFGLHAITGKLHVARQCLIFFEQLGGIAALAVVLAIAIRTTGHTLGTLSTATATAAALTIVDQQFCSLSHRAPQRGRP